LKIYDNFGKLPKGATFHRDLAQLLIGENTPKFACIIGLNR